MALLVGAARALLIRRLLRGGRSPRRGPSGFRMRGPFPTYSGRTRRGTRVSVGGCCLPIPFTLALAAVVGLIRSGPVRRRRRATGSAAT